VSDVDIGWIEWFGCFLGLCFWRGNLYIRTLFFCRGVGDDDVFGGILMGDGKGLGILMRYD